VATVIDLTSEGLTTSQLQVVVVQARGEEEQVAIMAEEQVEAAPTVAEMVLHGVAAEEVLVSTIASGDTREEMAEVELY
jgi:hypothetical protein